jgi:DNA-binding CsgD family transcriptional regulator
MDPQDYPAGGPVVSLSLIKNQQSVHRLADILRKRRGPLFLLIGAGGALQYSSLPDSAPPGEHRLLGQAYAEAQSMINAGVGHSCQPDESDPAPECQRGALTMLDDLVYSVRLFQLFRAARDRDLRESQYAVIIEPIVGPLTDGVDFSRIKEKFRLSNRELDVLIALMTGTKDKQIARSLGVSAGTVRAYLKIVRAKLGVTTRTAIVNLVHEVAGKNAATDED